MAQPVPPVTEAVPGDLDRLWQAALGAWGYGVDLSPPVAIPGQNDDLAYIDLKTRQTHVNFAKLASLGLEPHTEAVLSHEVGHHARFPQTLVKAAKLALRQRRLLQELETGRPGLPRIGKAVEWSRFDFLLNLFLDVLINDSLRSERNYDFPAVYREATKGAGQPPSAVMSFTFALYGALWDLREHSILSDRGVARLDGISAGWREEAGRLAEGLRGAGENLFLGLDLYVEAVWPYVVADAREGTVEEAGGLEAVLTGGLGDLDPDELADVVRGSGAEREADEARERSRRPVFVELPPDPEEDAGKGKASAPGPSGPLDAGELAKILGAGKEFGGKAADASAVVRAYYEKLADKILIRLPEEPALEPQVPATLEAWDPSEDPGRIDWPASLGRAGVAIPGVTLLEREHERETVGLEAQAPPWMEIYIDSSGSMPDPRAAFSPIVFAGFLLARAAIDAGSRVRIIQYSGPGDLVIMSDFSSDKQAVFRALIQYFGDGTAFPFRVLGESLDRFRSYARIERVALTDIDFFFNAANPSKKKGAGPLGVLGRAARPPNRLTAILNTRGISDRSLESFAPPGLKETGIRVIPVGDWNELHGIAATLGREIFGRLAPSRVDPP